MPVACIVRRRQVCASLSMTERPVLDREVALDSEIQRMEYVRQRPGNEVDATTAPEEGDMDCGPSRLRDRSFGQLVMGPASEPLHPAASQARTLQAALQEEGAGRQAASARPHQENATDGLRPTASQTAGPERTWLSGSATGTGSTPDSVLAIDIGLDGASPNETPRTRTTRTRTTRTRTPRTRTASVMHEHLHGLAR
jgi:hypothetical protein